MAKTPKFHIAKRKALPWYSALGIRAIAVVLALIVCAFVTMAFTGEDPLAVYKTMFYGAFGTARKTWILLQNIAILLCVSLAVTPAFKMRFWNIGGEGQMLIGGLATAACMILLGDKIPNALLIALMFMAALLAGAVWGALPAICKARWNTNETLFTLMMNYVATQLVAFFVIVWEVPKGAGKIGIINQSTQAGWLPQIGSYKYLLNVLIVAVLTILMYIYLTRSKQGYEIAVVGESENTARYAGMNVPFIIMRTMFISGAISGVVGFMLASGANNTLYDGVAAGVGFTAITVAWLAQLNPFAMVGISLLLGVLDKGADTLQTQHNVPASISDIITGIFLFCMLGCEFFINYRLIFRGSHKEVAK